MRICNSCHTQNVDTAKFCIRCGTALTPAPESWRDPAGSFASAETQQENPSGMQTPQPPSGFPSYVPPQMPTPFAQSGETMHPVVPAIVSFLLPGLGLLFVPGKAGLGIAIFVGTIVYSILAIILSFVGIGFCMFLALPLVNVVSAVHSFDESAKMSRGKFQPLLFK